MKRFSLVTKTLINSAHLQRFNYDYVLPMPTPTPTPTPPTANLNLTALCKEGQLKKALHILLTTHNPPADCNSYLQLLQTSIAKNALSQGEQIHSLITQWGFAFAMHTTPQNKLIDMYVKCGHLVDARKLFEDMIEQDVSSWNTIIAAYRRHGHPHEALTLFHEMQQADVQPDQFTFATVLPACSKIRALEQGLHIHQSIMERGFSPDVVVASALVDMYAKCGSIHKARELFDKMPQRNVVSWNAMITGYAQNGDLDQALRIFKEMPRPDVISWNAMAAGYVRNGFVEKALETFKQMQLSGLKPNSSSFASILPACAKIGALEQGIDIHQSIIETGCLSDVVVVNALIDMYAKCGSIHKARELFDKMPQRDTVSWNALIAGYAQSDVLDEALRLFKEMPQRNVVSWNVMIGGYAQHGFVEKAIETYKQMQLARVKRDSTTFASILPACAKMGALDLGMDIHQSIIESGFWSDVMVVNALIDMYAKHGSICKACKLFDKMPYRDVVSWNVMIGGYAQSGDFNKALRLFKEMPQRNVVSWNAMVAACAQNGFIEKAIDTFKQMQLAGLKPNTTTFASILPGCAKMGALEQGKDIHQSIIKSGFLSDVVVVSSLVDMYAKCGSIHKAHKLFDKMSQRNIISWNTMIAGYAQNGFVEKALETFNQMKLECVKPDSTTFTSMLPVCAKMGALEQGMDIHQSIIESGFLLDVIVANALIDMYAKCGSIHKAREIFDKIPQRDLVSWTAMIAGYAQNGFCKDALKVFEQMKLTETYPDHNWAGGVRFKK